MKRKPVAIIVLLIFLAAAYVVWQKHSVTAAHRKYNDKNAADKPVPVVIATSRTGDIDVLVDALGTVTARKTVTIKSLVDGQLVRVAFREGQSVKAGDLLDVIDPRPFQVALDQAVGQLMRDQALLQDAQLDLTRYQGLLAKNSIPSQQVDTQLALVRQYQGTVLTDRALIANARLQLVYSRITAPVTGRVGLRLVDQGNMVHASDTTGLVILTQTQPIDVVFPIPQQDLGEVEQQLRAGKALEVDAYDQADQARLAMGALLAVDSQINVTTGTVNLKAVFANTDNTLFPNQFVNAHLRVKTLHDVVLVPVAALQTGTQGTFVFVADAANSVWIQPVKTGPEVGETVAILQGLAPNQHVVVDGTDKLRAGSRIVPSLPGVARPAFRSGMRQHRVEVTGRAKGAA
ncbi:MAG: MdtA/MuxA family multidrug efflux RND transporter periplasmic adaptor subunit [Burkholderiales bacterium]